MTIPKKIHYCWFGGAPLPELAIRCIASWRIYCPDYEIIRWDETNTDLNSCKFVREAYEKKKWAFVSDYIRLKVIAEHGGIYLDIDVELLKPLEPFLHLQGFMGFEQAEPYCVNTGLGFGAEENHSVIKMLLREYEKQSFIRPDGSFDMTPCPVRDSGYLASIGFVQNNKHQNIHGIHIYPSDFFSPISLLGRKNFTENTVSIHHFNASWLSQKQSRNLKARRVINKIFGQKIEATLLNYIKKLISKIKFNSN